MNKFKTLLFLAVFGGIGLWGCDDSSSASSDETGVSSSSVESSDSESSSAVDKKSSGEEAYEKDKSSSSFKGSEPAELSSSSAKETKNSSDSKSSSSVKSDDSSSSLSTCPPEKEGKTKMVAFTGVTSICPAGYCIEVSSSSAASSSSYFDMTNQFNSDIKYGTHTDSRDGVTDKTITIKYGYYGVDSLTFFAENLNFGKMVQSSEQQGDSTKYCYDNDPWYCEHGFGGLYSWNTVMKFPAACNNASIGSDDCPSNYDYPKGSLSKHDVFHKGICDEGWHVMHEGEWALLWERAGISSVASAHGSYVFVLKPPYLGFNKSGFSILPAGRFVPSEGGFSDLGEGARFWRPEQDEENSQKASFIYVPSLGDDFSLQRVAVKENAYSVRCVKDYKPEN